MSSFYQLGRCILEILLYSLFDLMKEELHPEYQDFGKYMEHYFRNDLQGMKETLKLIDSKTPAKLIVSLYLFFSLNSTKEQLHRNLDELKLLITGEHFCIQDQSFLVEGLVHQRKIKLAQEHTTRIQEDGKSMRQIFDEENLNQVIGYMNYFLVSGRSQEGLHYIQKLGISKIWRTPALTYCYLYFLRSLNRKECIQNFFLKFVDEELRLYYKQTDKQSYINIQLEESYLGGKTEEYFSQLYQLARSMTQNSTQYQAKIKMTRAVLVGKEEDLQTALTFSENYLSMKLEKNKQFYSVHDNINILLNSLNGQFLRDDQRIEICEKVLFRFNQIDLVANNRVYFDVTQNIGTILLSLGQAIPVFQNYTL